MSRSYARTLAPTKKYAQNHLVRSALVTVMTVMTVMVTIMATMVIAPAITGIGRPRSGHKRESQDSSDLFDVSQFHDTPSLPDNPNNPKPTRNITPPAGKSANFLSASALLPQSPASTCRYRRNGSCHHVSHLFDANGSQRF